MRLLRGLFTFALLTPLLAQEPPAPPPEPAAPAAAEPAPAKPNAAAKPSQKGSGLVRQRTSVKRQMGGLDELGWLFRPWSTAKPDLTPRQE